MIQELRDTFYDIYSLIRTSTMRLYLYLNRGYGEVNSLTEALSDNRFYFPIYNAIATACLERGWDLQARLSRYPGEMLEECRVSKPNGIIFNGHDFSPALNRYLTHQAARIPVVNLSSPWLTSPFLSVGLDDDKAFTGLTRHLAQEGYKHLAFVQPATTAVQFEETRYRHIAATCLNLGLPVPGWFHLDWNATTAPDWLRDPRRPEAVICSNDTLADRLLSISKRMGLRVPEDLGVCGCHGFLRGARGPVVTTMEFDFAKLGLGAIEQVESRLSSHGRSPPPIRAKRIPPSFHIGNTSLRRTLGLKHRLGDFLRVADDILEAHFKARDCMKRAAQACGVGPIHFQRTFKRLNGMSFNRKWTRKRLEWVALELTRTSSAVKDLATEVGFKNSGYFYAAFKKEFGVNPKDYRKGGKGPPEDAILPMPAPPGTGKRIRRGGGRRANSPRPS